MASFSPRRLVVPRSQYAQLTWPPAAFNGNIGRVDMGTGGCGGPSGSVVFTDRDDARNVAIILDGQASFGRHLRVVCEGARVQPSVMAPLRAGPDGARAAGPRHNKKIG